MAASDALTDLATRARAAEDRVAAAQKQARAQLQTEVDQARSTAQQTANGLQAQTAASAADVSQWWHDLQQNWSGHVAQVRQSVQTKAADVDAKMLKRRADSAEGDAVAAVEFAEAALEEAEYAVLNATLARADADASQASR